MEQWHILDVAQAKDDQQALRYIKLNCLGDLFYFTLVGLRRKRLTVGLHLPLCRSLMQEHLSNVIEMPRDHFKSTCAGEGLPMWRSLPISDQDVDDVLKLGYSDNFVKWLIRIHRPELRNVLISENITNAAKLGRKIRWHYESNATYRSLFPETLPDASCTWTDFSLHVKLPKNTMSMGGAHGEGTFDFLGVGSAIQSRHYNGLAIEDDLVGKKAIESQSIMDKTIEYHQLLANATESEDPVNEADRLVIGNRWSYFDLNSWIKENEPWFKSESHSAEGGCCALHPINTPIFPEEFSLEKLARRKQSLGSYRYSCQFLNNPASPDNADFQLAWLRYYRLIEDEVGDLIIQRETTDGIVYKPFKTKFMAKAMTVDPNHSGNSSMGRCRHAIVVIGMDPDGNQYLLEEWAMASSYDTFYDKIFKVAEKWGLRRVGVETIAAQKYIKYHIEYRNRSSDWPLRVDELKGEVESPDGTLTTKKEWRIRNVIAPIAEFGKLWVQRSQTNFINEYQTFPQGKFKDVLDAYAYAPQLVRQPIDYKHHMAMINRNKEQMERLGRPYTAGYGRYGNA